MVRTATALFLLLSIFSCSPKLKVIRELKALENELHDHTGFSLYDPHLKKSLIEFQSDRYFTPASNTKIFTFYTAVKLLKDSLHALKYEIRNDSSIIWGLGDPSLLYPEVQNNARVYNFLKQLPGSIHLSGNQFQAEHFGPGWAWDDYPSYYSAERSAFPVYGNLITILQQNNNFKIVPFYFSSDFKTRSDSARVENITRSISGNNLIYQPGKKKQTRWIIPFQVNDAVAAKLLADTLKRSVTASKIPMSPKAKLLKSIPLDSALRVMMQISDNFIAEQLLLQCAAVLGDTLKPEIAIQYARKKLLNDLPDKLQWVDGSGLSRYNLFTPRSIVKLWEIIYYEVPQQRLFPLLASGGKNGTLKNHYKGNQPIIFGKTGTLSNNSTLSGYLITRKGKVLIFSMMNNNYLAPSTEVRKRVEKILNTIHTKY